MGEQKEKGICPGFAQHWVLSQNLGQLHLLWILVNSLVIWRVHVSYPFFYRLQGVIHRLIYVGKNLQSPAINLTLPSPPLNCVPKCHIWMSSKYLQGWWFHHFLLQCVLMVFGEDIFLKCPTETSLVTTNFAFSTRLRLDWQNSISNKNGFWNVISFYR